jgi:myosin heavy subunit
MLANFKGHPNYESERVPSRDAFGVRHYAGLVIYDAGEFLEKNRDVIPIDLLEVFNSSVFDVIKELFDTKDARRPCAFPLLPPRRTHAHTERQLHRHTQVHTRADAFTHIHTHTHTHRKAACTSTTYTFSCPHTQTVLIE